MCITYPHRHNLSTCARVGPVRHARPATADHGKAIHRARWHRHVIDAHITASNGGFPRSKAKAATPQHQNWLPSSVAASAFSAGPPIPAIPAVTTPATRTVRQPKKEPRPRPWMNRGRGRGRVEGSCSPSGTCVQLRRRILPVEVRCHPAAATARVRRPSSQKAGCIGGR